MTTVKTEAAFTPGPWIAPPYSSVVGLGIVGPRGQVIATVAIHPGFNPQAPHEIKAHIEYADEVRANARLIAAAPELYEALHQLTSNASLASIHLPSEVDILASALFDTLSQADAALAKARGDAPSSKG